MSDLFGDTWRKLWRRVRPLIDAMAEELDYRPSHEKLKAQDVAPDIRLTAGGVIRLGNSGFMHPSTFREHFGEEAFNEVMSRPRVISKHDSWTGFASCSDPWTDSSEDPHES